MEETSVKQIIVELQTGRIIGEHQGIHNYTLGKRVSIDQKLFPNHEGVFVIRPDLLTNTLYVVSFLQRFVRNSNFICFSVSDLIINCYIHVQFALTKFIGFLKFHQAKNSNLDLGVSELIPLLIVKLKF